MKLAYAIVIFTVVAGLIWPVQAFELTSVLDAKVDTSIIKESGSYTTPDSILIAPLFAPNNLEVSSDNRYRGIFHYTIDRLGYTDIPFHYILTPEGKIYEGNSKGDESRVLFSNFSQNPVVIAYLADEFNNQFDTRAYNALKELSLSVANRNSIESKNIFINEVVFVRERQTKAVSMQTKEVFGAWNTSRDEIAKYVSDNYSPESKPYSVDVLGLTLPTEEVEPGEIVTATIKLKNTGKYGMYPFSNSELILSKEDGTNSIFFVNNDWESQSQTSLFENESSLAPNEENEFSFKLYAPLYIGEKSEKFKLVSALGATVESEPIELKLNMKSSSKKIIEIRNRGYDYYPVYSQASSSSAEVYRAVSGQRFFFLEDIGNGWYSIDLGNDSTGWIAYWNVEFIN